MKKNFWNKILCVITAAAVIFTTMMPTQDVKAAGGTLPSATNISFASARDLVFDTSIAEDTKSGDSLRYYKFSLSGASELDIRGNFATDSWRKHFYLYDSSMTQLSDSSDYGSFNASFYLTGGDYYLKFDSYEDYNFVASANQMKESFVETQTHNNNVVSLASPMNLIQQYKGALTLNDNIDYYKFEAATNGTAILNLTNATNKSLKYAIYDKFLNSVYVNTVGSGAKIAGEKVVLSKGTYYFVVTNSDNNNGVGSYNFQIDYTVKVPNIPKIKSVQNNSGKKMTIKWGKVANTSGYELQYSTNSKFKNSVTKKAISSNMTSSKYTKLKKGKTYYVKMRTYINVNGVKTYSKWSKIVQIKINK